VVCSEEPQQERKISLVRSLKNPEASISLDVPKPAPKTEAKPKKQKRLFIPVVVTSVIILCLFVTQLVYGFGVYPKSTMDTIRKFFTGALTADITITATPNWHSGVTEFTATWVTDSNVLLEWALPGDALNTMIRVKHGDYPENTTDGYLIYYGDAETANDTMVNLDATGEAYYSAFTEYPEGYSTSYSTDLVEGEGMLLIGETMQNLLLILIFVVLNGLAFWQRHIFLYCLAVPVDLIFGFYWAVQGELYSPEWAEGIIIAVIGIFCLFRVVMKLFKSSDGAKG
jgi:hypothetical protein